MKTDRNRRAQSRDDPAAHARAEQRRAERSLKRLFLILLIVIVAVGLLGYALGQWWR